MFATTLALLSLATAPALADDSPSLTLSPELAPEHLETESFVGAGGGGEKHRIPLLAAGLNFFLPGAGYLYNGEKPVYVSLPMMAGGVGLTYVEQFHQFEKGNLQEQDSTAFGVMFGAVLILNTGTAIDAFREARAINGTAVSKRSGKDNTKRSVALSPTALPGESTMAYGLNLDANF